MARRTDDRDARERRRAAVVRALLASAQAATIAVTWPLWQARAEPPLLPYLDLPQVSLGVPLLLTLAWAVWRPRSGLALHGGCLLLGLLLDRTRLQPQVLFPVLLMASTLPGPSWRLVGQAHLAAMWIFAGLHKLLSGAYAGVFGGTVVQTLFPTLTPHQCQLLAVWVAAAELGVGLVALVRSLWPAAALLGAGLHFGIFLSLSPVGIHHNSSVWYWNLATALGALWVFRDGDLGLRLWRRARVAARVAVVVLLVTPLGFYLDWVNPYLAYNLYAGNSPKAEWHRADGTVEGLRFLPDLNSFLPPSRAMFQAAFEARAGPGDRLVIRDSRAWVRRQGRGTVTLERPR